MTELATFKSITELTEELFYRMVGDYFLAGNRIEEIQKLIADLKESEKKLPKMDAFETYAEYLAAARAHQSWHELTDPTVERLKEEQETIGKRKEVLTERLKELLPRNVWLRYGDMGIRAKRWTRFEYFGNLGCFRDPYFDEDDYPNTPLEWTQLEVASWEKIRPIPKTISRTKKGEKSDAARLLGKVSKPWKELPYVPQAACLLAVTLASIAVPFVLFGTLGLLVATMIGGTVLAVVLK